MPEDTRVLAFDTAMNGCTVGVWSADAGLVAGQSLAMPRGQAEVLVPMIEGVLKEAGVAYSDLGRIAVTAGPGAFTGMRIGLATARALGVTLGIPVTGVSVFEALLGTYIGRYGALTAGRHYGVLIETKRDDYYFRVFDADGKSCSAALSAGVSDILEAIRERDVVLIGDAVERFTEEAGAAGALDRREVLLPSAEVIAALAVKNGTDCDRAQPFYIRPPDVCVRETSLLDVSK